MQFRWNQLLLYKKQNTRLVTNNQCHGAHRQHDLVVLVFNFFLKVACNLFNQHEDFAGIWKTVETWLSLYSRYPRDPSKTVKKRHACRSHKRTSGEQRCEVNSANLSRCIFEYYCIVRDPHLEPVKNDIISIGDTIEWPIQKRAWATSQYPLYAIWLFYLDGSSDLGFLDDWDVDVGGSEIYTRCC